MEFPYPGTRMGTRTIKIVLSDSTIFEIRVGDSAHTTQPIQAQYWHIVPKNASRNILIRKINEIDLNR